jgi:hypothetical protein
MSLAKIPAWAEGTLQGLAFWLGYQDALGIGSRLSEGAIATEFLHLMRVHSDSDKIVEPEVMYRHIRELDSKEALRNIRADFVVANQERAQRNLPYPKNAVEDIVEVKHGRSTSREILKDIDRIGKYLKSCNWTVRGFLLFAQLRGRPRMFTDHDGSALRKIEVSNQNTRFKVRRVCRAVSRIPGRKGLDAAATGNYAVLIEVVK